ncbi:uncharacterized protein LOC100181620 [Ciona intestinalis]
MSNIWDIVVSSTCACAVCILIAEILRLIVNHSIEKWRKDPRSPAFLADLSEIFDSAISAFTYVASTFEKGLLLTVGLRSGFFLVSFILGVVFCYTSSNSDPTPIYPLVKYWRTIRLGIHETNHPSTLKRGFVTSAIRSTVTYFKLGWRSLLGQAVGLFVAISWSKYFWDGWLTSHHVNQLARLDECSDCQNTAIFLAFLIETGITYIFFVAFGFIDEMFGPRGGDSNPMRSDLMCNVLKNLVALLSMHFFLDVTGSFANPYLAYAIQRHCIVDVTRAAIFTFVYVIGPFLGTIVYLLRPITWETPKTKRSV